MDYSNLFVCLMGICTVFIGLICIIVLVTAMSAVVRRTERRNISTAPVSLVAAPTANTISAELVAAVSAAVAEELDRDISAIRIASIKRV